MFSVGVLAYSVYLILGSVNSYSEGQTEQFYYSVILGLIGIALAVSSLSTMRRRIQVIKSQSFKTFTVDFCEKCSFKKLREFKVGDYVHLKVGACPQCGADLRINTIYAESPKD